MHTTHISLSEALARWKGIEELEVVEKQEAEAQYGSNTLRLSRSIEGALRPTSVEDVQRIVIIANETCDLKHIPMIQ